MSYTTHNGLRRSARLSNDNDKLDNFEHLIDTIVEKKFSFRPIDGKDRRRRYPLRDNTRISYSSFFNLWGNDDGDQGYDGCDDVTGDHNMVVMDVDDLVKHSYNLRSRRRVRFSTDL